MKRILRIRWKTLGPSLVAIGLLVMLTGWIGTSRLMNHFRGLERNQVARTQVQVERALGARLDNLRVHGLDWSSWDDAVSWLSGEARDFPNSNLNPGSLSNLDLDALWYWDAGFRRVGGLRTEHGESIDRSLDSLVRRIGSTRNGWTGIVRTDSVLNFCTIQPVLPSSGTGVARGWLAMARRIDRREDSLLAAQLQVPTRILARGDTVGISSWGEGDSGVLAWRIPILVGDPAIVEIRLDRPMIAVGRDASRQFLMQLLVGLAVVMVLSLAILERFVLARIARLADAVTRIRHQQSEGVDLVDLREDELGNLSRRIQEMVETDRDIRRKLESALDLAETSSRARMHFLQSMTHELRTPLNGVIGLTDIALKGSLDAEVREALELSRSAALGLLETINGVLEFSRLEKGEVDLVPEEVDPVEVLLDASRVLSFEAERKGLDFLFLASPQVPAKVVVDPARLRRIFVNLAGNAVKYTLSGKVVVSVSWEEVSGTLGVSVRDTGIGIASDRLEAIFQPFVQADDESAIRFGGTGLGLSVARTLADSMGSRIQVRSTPGVGSEFWFSLALPVVSGPAVVERPTGAVQWDISRPELAVFLRSAIPTDGKGMGILVTDSLEKAVSVPERTVVLCKGPDLRRTKSLMDDGRSEIVVFPFRVGELAQAIIRCEHADATIAILASGRILAGMLTGLLEGAGYRTLAVGSPEEFEKISAYGIVQAAVADMEDPVWKPCLERAAVPVVLVGEGEDPKGRLVLPKPIRREQLYEAMVEALRRKGPG